MFYFIWFASFVCWIQSWQWKELFTQNLYTSRYAKFYTFQSIHFGGDLLHFLWARFTRYPFVLWSVRWNVLCVFRVLFPHHRQFKIKTEDTDCSHSVYLKLYNLLPIIFSSHTTEKRNICFLFAFIICGAMTIKGEKERKHLKQNTHCPKKKEEIFLSSILQVFPSDCLARVKLVDPRHKYTHTPPIHVNK